MKSTVFASLALGIAALALAGCSDGGADTTAKAEEGIPGMSITNARMVLAPVAGNPAAIYFDLDYEGDRNLALSRAKVEGAKSATFHDYGEYNFQTQMMDMLPLPLKKGDKISFAPGGKHIMAMGVSPDLHAGGKTDVTIVVSGGKSQTFSADIRAAGDER